MLGPGAGGHFHCSNGHHASRNERITKSSEQSVEHSMVRNRREKYLVFESPRRTLVYTNTGPQCTAGVDHRALRGSSVVCSFFKEKDRMHIIVTLRTARNPMAKPRRYSNIP